jgi:hypothetical protein
LYMYAFVPNRRYRNPSVVNKFYLDSHLKIYLRGDMKIFMKVSLPRVS